MRRVTRQAIAVAAGWAVGLALLAAPAAAATPRPCADLRDRVLNVAIDYALERSAEGPLAEAPDLDIRMVVEGCQRRSARRAVWSFRLRIRDVTVRPATEVVSERGTLEVTPRRQWVTVRQTAPAPTVASPPQAP